MARPFSSVNEIIGSNPLSNKTSTITARTASTSAAVAGITGANHSNPHPSRSGSISAGGAIRFRQYELPTGCAVGNPFNSPYNGCSKCSVFERSHPDKYWIGLANRNDNANNRSSINTSRDTFFFNAIRTSRRASATCRRVPYSPPDPFQTPICSRFRKTAICSSPNGVVPHRAGGLERYEQRTVKGEEPHENYAA